MKNAMEDPTDKPTVILGVIGADCHAVGNKIMMSVFNRLGFDIVNLGVMVSQEEFVNAAIEHQAEAILVSSIYGHGAIDCQGFRDLCAQHGLADIILYVGGNLVIGKHTFSEVERQFLQMGFDRVFSSRVDLEDVAALLRQDIRVKQRQRVAQLSKPLLLGNLLTAPSLVSRSTSCA